MNIKFFLAGIFAVALGFLCIGNEMAVAQTADAANLTIKVIVENSASTNALPSHFTVNVAGTRVSKTGFQGSDNGTWITLGAGSYSVSVAPPSGGAFTSSQSGECSGNISAGQNKLCTFTFRAAGGSASPLPPSGACANGATLTASEARSAASQGLITLSQITADRPAMTIRGSITNNTKCTLPASMAVFTIDDPNDPNFMSQTLFEGTSAVNIAPGATQTFSLRMPVCNFQADYFYSNSYPNPRGSRSNPSAFFLDGGYLVNRAAAGGFACAAPTAIGPNPPKLIVKKEVFINGVRSGNAGDFTINVSGNSVSPSTFRGSEAGVTVSLSVGSYSVTETPVENYTVSYSSDCNGVMLEGQTKTCTITNVRTIAPTSSSPLSTLVVIKRVINDDDGNRRASDFTMTISGNNVSQSSFRGRENGTTVTLSPGSYSVDEADSLGYSKSRSGDCSGTIASGETKVCVITNDDRPRESRGEVLAATTNLICIPPSTTALLGAQVTFTAQGGDGSYRWTVSELNQTYTGRTLTIIYNSPGFKTVRVESAGQSAVCSLTIGEVPITPYFPSTGRMNDVQGMMNAALSGILLLMGGVLARRIRRG